LSYVIQNFYENNKKLTITPKFKFLFILKNLEKFFIFFKINTFLNLTNKLNFLNINLYSPFFKYFFSKYYIKLIFQLNFNLLGNYINNLTKSYIYNVFYNLLKYFTNSFNFFPKKHSICNKFLFNLYFYTIKTINVRINNNFYKNIFFYFMLINPFLWYQHTSNLKFYLNFIFVNYSLKISRFYNGHFLRIYNF
jgi:hypothetical protein